MIAVEGVYTGRGAEGGRINMEGMREKEMWEVPAGAVLGGIARYGKLRGQEVKSSVRGRDSSPREGDTTSEWWGL